MSCHPSRESGAIRREALTTGPAMESPAGSPPPPDPATRDRDRTPKESTTTMLAAPSPSTSFDQDRDAARRRTLGRDSRPGRVTLETLPCPGVVATPDGTGS